MTKRRLDPNQPIDVPVSGAGVPTMVSNGFIRAAQDTSPQRFKNTGAPAREQWRMLMAQIKDRASGLSGRDRANVLDRPINMGGVVSGNIDQSNIGQGEIFQWSDRTPNLTLNKKLKQHLKDSNYVAEKAKTGHYGQEAQKHIVSRNGYPTYSPLGKHFLAVHNGDYQAETNRLSDLIDQNDPETIKKHAMAAGVKVLWDPTSVGSHRQRVYVAPEVIQKTGEKEFTNNDTTPVTAKDDVNNLPKALRLKDKKRKP